MIPAVEIRPPIPFPMATPVVFDPPEPAFLDADVDDWVWAMRLEEELDYALLARDNSAGRRQRLVGRVRVVAFLALVASVVAVVQVAANFGVVAAIVAAWAAPVAVLAVVLSAEKLLLRFTR